MVGERERVMGEEPVGGGADRRFQYLVAGVLSALSLLGSLIYYSLDARLKTMEQLGAPAIREKIAGLESESRSVQRDLGELRADMRMVLELVRLMARDQARDLQAPPVRR